MRTTTRDIMDNNRNLHSDSIVRVYRMITIVRNIFICIFKTWFNKIVQISLLCDNVLICILHIN